MSDGTLLPAEEDHWCQHLAYPKQSRTEALARVERQPFPSVVVFKALLTRPIYLPALPLPTLVALFFVLFQIHQAGQWRIWGVYSVLFAEPSVWTAPCLPIHLCLADSLLQVRCHGNFFDPQLLPSSLCSVVPSVAAMTSCTIEFSTVCKALSHPSHLENS